MDGCMKITEKQYREARKEILINIFEIMPNNWGETFLDTFNSVCISYFGLKGIDAMNEATDLGSDKVNKLGDELFHMYFSETFNRKSSGLKAEKAFYAKMTKRYQEGKAITAVPDPLDLVHLSIAYLGDMFAILIRYAKANLISESMRFEMYSSLGKAQFWAGVLRGQLVGGQINSLAVNDSLSINARIASKASHAKHYKLRDMIQSFWIENRDKYPTQEKAALAAMEKFGTTFETTKRHISKKSQELRGKGKK